MKNGSAKTSASNSSSSLATDPKFPELKKKQQKIFETIIALFAFLCCCYYTKFIPKIFRDKRINKWFILIFVLSVILFGFLYFILVYKLRWSKPKERRIPVNDWMYVYPTLVSTCVCLLALAMISFIVALFPAFHFWSLVLCSLGFLSTTYILQWIPI